MRLSDFLGKFNLSAKLITTYTGKDALKAVGRNGDALRYVKDQTEAICLKAVESNGYALQYVNPEIFDKE